MIEKIIDPDVKTFLLCHAYSTVCVEHARTEKPRTPSPSGIGCGTIWDWSNVSYSAYALPEVQKTAIKLVLAAASLGGRGSSSFTLLFKASMTFKARRMILLNRALFMTTTWLHGNRYEAKPSDIGRCLVLDDNLLELDRSGLVRILADILRAEIWEYPRSLELATRIVDKIDR